jgi:hypothetical protein
MNKDIIIKEVLELPRKYYAEANDFSMYQLLVKTEYSFVKNEINLDDIRSSLEKHPEYMEGWIEWSENKRASGWYIETLDNNCYSVGLFDSKMGRIRETTYDSKVDACAQFVKEEIDSIIDL